MSTRDVLEAEDFFPDASTASTAGGPEGTLNGYLQECERNYIRKALIERGWQILQTAERLGISRKSLWEKMRKLDIRED